MIISREAIEKKQFVRGLLQWNTDCNDRQMPWKGEKDPYKIWLSEVMLQQTRVEQGLKYYLHFIKAYPTVEQLAKASEQEVFKHWEGLGYYSRCRNLIASARYIANDLAGKFPDSYDEIKKLKGVGPYTAAAIASFAYNLPHAVVDGNVFRVLARVFGIATPIDSTEGKKQFAELAQLLLPQKQAGVYNQAIMDFGAVVCKPAAPLCNECFFQKKCIAAKSDLAECLPVKTKKNTIKKRWFYYCVLVYKNQLVIRQRSEKDIWQNLYEFPMIEQAANKSNKAILTLLSAQLLLHPDDIECKKKSETNIQQLSHQLIQGKFLIVQLKQQPILPQYWFWIKKSQLTAYAFPQLIVKWMQGLKSNIFS